MNILITGGTGFLGQELTKKLLEYPEIKIHILSRNEHKQAEMKSIYEKKQIEFYLGDIRILDDIKLIFLKSKIDMIIHTAAIKRIDSAEKNIFHTIDTNIYGTKNLLYLANEFLIKRFLFISSDKASRPHTTYGATKYIGEELTRKSQGWFERSVFRYGNIIGSTGSLLNIWKEQSKNGFIIVTHPEMTRFFWHVTIAAQYIIENGILPLKLYENIYIPKKMEALNIYDLAKFLYPKIEIKINKEIIHNEKIHEELYPGFESKDHIVRPQDHKGLQLWLK